VLDCPAREKSCRGCEPMPIEKRGERPSILAGGTDACPPWASRVLPDEKSREGGRVAYFGQLRLQKRGFQGFPLWRGNFLTMANEKVGTSELAKRLGISRKLANSLEQLEKLTCGSWGKWIQSGRSTASGASSKSGKGKGVSRGFHFGGEIF
jgi:hypothetical protein